MNEAITFGSQNTQIHTHAHVNVCTRAECSFVMNAMKWHIDDTESNKAYEGISSVFKTNEYVYFAHFHDMNALQMFNVVVDLN